MKKTQAYQHILFDLDGTLVDSEPGITASVLFALEALGIEEPDPKLLRRFIGPPLYHSFAAYYALDEVKVEAAVAYYRDHYKRAGIFQCTLYAGVVGLLQGLHQRGRRLYLATAKPTIFAERILEHFQLRDLLSGVVGSNLDGTRIEKGPIIKEALSLLTPSERKRAVMIGDRHYDILGAKENGIDAIAVYFGYGDKAELDAVQPTASAANVEELKDILVF